MITKDRQIYYEIESILSEIGNIINSEKGNKIPISIMDSFVELQDVSDNLENILFNNEFDLGATLINLRESYQEVIDVYVDYLEIQASYICD